MLLPSKLFSYQESVLPLLPEILTRLDEPQSPRTLAQTVSGVTNNPTRLIDALDCLYALGKITLTDEGMIERC